MLDVIVDIILVLVVFMGLILGWKRGFVGIVAKPVKFVASIGIAFGFSGALAEKIVTPMIKGPATNYVKDFLYTNCQSVTVENASEELPTILKIAAAIFNIDITNVAENATGTVIDAIAENLTAPVINVVSVVISFIALLIISNIVLALALGIINLIFKGGVLGGINKVLGVVFGVAFFLIISWALAVVFEFVVNLPALSEVAWAKDFEGGFVYKFFNEYNPIELLLSF
jgi:uncharacterized membrane protein required for colicin V production